MAEAQQAASQSGTAASGQAASAQQSAQQQSGQQSQGGSQQGAQQSGQQQSGQQASQATGEQQQGAQGQQAQQQAAAQQATAPERYDLRLPEQSPLDQTDVEAITTMAKAKGLTNEQAQAALTEMHSTLSAQHTTFRTELAADTEVGGAQLEATQLQAKRFMDRFLPEHEPDGRRLREAINKSGYGNWVPLIKMLARAGKAMGEDHGTGAAQQGQQPARRSQADRLFGDAAGVKPPA